MEAKLSANDDGPGSAEGGCTAKRAGQIVVLVEEERVLFVLARGSYSCRVLTNICQFVLVTSTVGT